MSVNKIFKSIIIALVVVGALIASSTQAAYSPFQGGTGTSTYPGVGQFLQGTSSLQYYLSTCNTAYAPLCLDSNGNFTGKIIEFKSASTSLSTNVLDEGQIGYATNTKSTFIGDGATAGGNPIGFWRLGTTTISSTSLNYAHQVNIGTLNSSPVATLTVGASGNTSLPYAFGVFNPAVGYEYLLDNAGNTSQNGSLYGGSGARIDGLSSGGPTFTVADAASGNDDVSITGDTDLQDLTLILGNIDNQYPSLKLFRASPNDLTSNFANFADTRVGIGTTSPISALAVVGTTTITQGLVSRGLSTSTFQGSINLPTGKCFAVNGVCVSGTGGSGTVTSISVTGANGIGVSGSPITTSGTVALSLGTITPSTINIGGGNFTVDNSGNTLTTALNVNGNVAVSDTGDVDIQAGTFSLANIFNIDGSGNTLTTGNVTLPNILHSVLATDNTGKIVATTTGGGGSGTVNSGTTGQVPWYASNGTTLTATSTLFLVNQKVGINNTSPSTALSVTGDTTLNGNLSFTPSGSGGAGTNRTIDFGQAYQNAALYLYNDGTSNGKWGWGLNGGEMQFFSTNFAGNHYSWNTGGNIQTPTSNELMRLQQGTSGGTPLLGIGTTSPVSTLSVVGTTTITQGVVSQGLATSTFAGSINLPTGKCFAVNGVCVTGGGGGSGTVNSGTTGQTPYYASSGTAVTATSTIFITTTSNVGIGTTTPTRKLEVAGDIGVQNILSNNDQFGYATGTNNIILGSNNRTGIPAISGSNNFFAGLDAGINTVAGSGNIFLGNSAGKLNVGGSSNVGIGDFAGQSLTSGLQNTFLGYTAGNNNDAGSYNTYLGIAAGSGGTGGGENVSIGESSGSSIASGAQNTFVGSLSGNSTSGSQNTLLGYRAGDQISSGSYNIVVGYETAVPNATGNQQLNIGSLIFGTGVNSNSSPSSAPVGGLVGIGSSTPTSFLSVKGFSGSASPLFTVASSSNTVNFQVDSKGHIVTNGQKPSVGAGSVSGNDTVGVITTGTSVTSITITWAQSRSNNYWCSLTDDNTAIEASITSTSSTQMVIGLGGLGLTNGHVGYNCQEFISN